MSGPWEYAWYFVSKYSILYTSLTYISKYVLYSKAYDSCIFLVVDVIYWVCGQMENIHTPQGYFTKPEQLPFIAMGHP